LSEPPTHSASVFYSFSAAIWSTREIGRQQFCHTAKKNGPDQKGAIHLVASLRSPVVVMVMMVMVMVMVVMTVRLCAWNRANRERNSGDGGQSESKFSH
jgi:hypothetical protein